MKTLFENSKGEVIEKKSKFICNMYYIENKEQAEKIIQETKKRYYDARHNCYAYVIYDANTNNLITKCSDDGEPSGTAGSPILNVLQSNDIVNSIAIVTRYFGGTLLGTGGLVRAYKEATKEAIKNSTLYNVEKGYLLNVELSYNDSEKLRYFCKINKINIIKIEYLNNIKYILEANEEKTNMLKDIFDDKSIKIDIICQKSIKTA